MTPDERLERLRRGEDPRLVARLPSGFVVMGEHQFWLGYCLLLAEPKMGQLNDLVGEARAQFLADMARVGDAVRVTTGCVRINYSVYGNLDPFLHAHVWPRYTDEGEWRTSPPLSVPVKVRESVPYSEEEHGKLRTRIGAYLRTNSVEGGASS